MRRRRTRIPDWVLPAAVAGALALVALVVGLALLQIDSRRAGAGGGGSAPVERQAFRDLLVGKTAEEVLEAAGTPERTQDLGGGRQNWYYRGRTFDPVTGAVDRRAQVTFRGGRVAAVNYY